MAYALLLISLLIPIISWANCLSWVLCPFVDHSTDAASIRLSISSSTFLGDTTWQEILVRGDGANGVGQALVCFESTATKSQVDTVATAAGCQVLNRGQVTALLVKPKRIYFDTEANSIKFMDGQGGRANQDESIGIPPGIDDDLVRGRR